MAKNLFGENIIYIYSGEKIYITKKFLRKFIWRKILYYLNCQNFIYTILLYGKNLYGENFCGENLLGENIFIFKFSI